MGKFFQQIMVGDGNCHADGFLSHCSLCNISNIHIVLALQVHPKFHRNTQCLFQCHRNIKGYRTFAVNSLTEHGGFNTHFHCELFLCHFTFTQLIFYQFARMGGQMRSQYVLIHSVLIFQKTKHSLQYHNRLRNYGTAGGTGRLSIRHRPHSNPHSSFHNAMI